jgi:uncharacterized protein (TIGR02271 family)
LNRPHDADSANLVPKEEERSSSPVLPADNELPLVIPVIREQLEVDKVVRNTGAVRIQKVVHESEEFIAESLRSDDLVVERVPRDLAIDSPPQIRTEGDVTVIPVVKEVLVVTKQLRLIEELRITRRTSVKDHQESVTLRAEEVIVERAPSRD